ncbi:hypothetical protein HZ992_16240 [Rhizobacter sp. AJA081-3]|uniref:hypothetical protein n=1 Tax=Rhizobacter sp. AJA081-3 TaxID=2753607 RepID=UPI001ADF9769|nr:hypothetical protein [Rhizobacter sp. AJA081-3]QTN21720.1 hypothetical protein HZ992_16240 [Rhizobacter sp. AJA081-3]
MRHPSRSRTVAAAIVVAVHLALLIAWMHDAVRPLGHAVPPRISVRLIAAAPPARAAEPAVAQPARTPVRRAPPAARAEAPRRDAIAPQAITMQAIAAEPAASQTATAPPAATEPLLDSEATRRALRASARDPGLAARAGRFGAEPLSPDARLGAEVQKSAKGDCLKGEYLGGGMGLLSLPFLAAAALREQCRR